MQKEFFILLEKRNGYLHYCGVFSNLSQLHKYLSKGNLLYWYDYKNVQHSLESYSAFYRKFKQLNFIAFTRSNGKEKRNYDVITDWVNKNSKY